MKLNNTIIQPLITEKSTLQRESDKYHFKVSFKATKHSIKEMIGKLFGVEVVDVRTVIVPGKKKRILRSANFTKTHKWKKAIVSVKKGQKIKLIEETK